MMLVGDARGFAMNRQERRKQKISAKPKTYTLTDGQISKLKADAVKEASEKAFIAMLGLPLLALRDEFGFGRGRLERFTNKLLEEYRCFDEGYVGLDELKQVIKDETGLDIYKT